MRGDTSELLLVLLLVGFLSLLGLLLVGFLSLVRVGMLMVGLKSFMSLMRLMMVLLLLVVMDLGVLVLVDVSSSSSEHLSWNLHKTVFILVLNMSKKEPTIPILLAMTMSVLA